MIGQRSSPGRVLFVCAMGLAFGFSVMAAAPFSAFVLPMARDFGWKRGDIAFAMTVFNGCNILLYPSVGYLADRLGVRRVIIPSILLFGVVMCSFSLFTGAIWQLYAGYALLAVLGVGIATHNYVRLIVAWFSSRRGMALGLALAGVGVGLALTPVIAQLVINVAGWRIAYVTLGALSIVTVLPFALLWAWDPPFRKIASTDAAGAPPAHVEGLSFREAVASRAFWLLFVTFTLLGILTGALPSNLIPLLVDRGITATQAAFMASTLGIAYTAGRLVTGYLLDRLYAPLLMASVIAIAIAGLFLMIEDTSTTLLYGAVSCIGFAMGCEIDFLSYMVSRYIGLRSFTRSIGLLLSGFSLGQSGGPALMGYSVNHYGSYDLAIKILVGLVALAIIPCLFYGPYPDRVERR